MSSSTQPTRCLYLRVHIGTVPHLLRTRMAVRLLPRPRRPSTSLLPSSSLRPRADPLAVALLHGQKGASPQHILSTFPSQSNLHLSIFSLFDVSLLVCRLRNAMVAAWLLLLNPQNQGTVRTLGQLDSLSTYSCLLT